MLACLLLLQQVALASHVCTMSAPAAPAVTHAHAGAVADHACASPHTSDCDTDAARCAQHCAQAAITLHDVAAYSQTHFPTAICPPARLLPTEPLAADAGLVTGVARAPPGDVPARLLYCSLQI